jgi:glycosyltransferase XagB
MIMAQVLSLKPVGVAPSRALGRPYLGDVLVRSGRLAREHVEAALSAQREQDTLLGTILVVGGVLSPDALADALSEQSGLGRADLHAVPPDPILLQGIDPLVCLRLDAIPWRRSAGRLEIAIANPSNGPAALAAFGADASLALAGSEAIRAAVVHHFGPRMRRHASERCPKRLSCRTLLRRGVSWRKAAVGLGLVAGIVAEPWAVLNVALAWLLLANLANLVLRGVALLTRLRRGAQPVADVPRLVDYRRLPKVSVLVPLWREERVAEQLLKALGAMEYPAPLLDIKLVLEEEDVTTRAAIERCTLPPTIEIVTVPFGALRTKPLAMNYALPFCRGDIVGVYDAEDRPDPGQLRAVVHHLMDSGPEVACVQGYLDFYNDRKNWIARAFTVEYAVWFRVFLTGVQRLGLPVPLGGTTVFFRRRVLEEIGAWDAHNVTEDADLGMRLARFGYRCEMIPTTTLEEANCAGALAWIGQRSRWNKGYAITWASHMRRPLRLRRELGWMGFLGFQVLFLGSLTASAAIPFYWLTALGWLGLGLPVWSHVPPLLAWALLASGFTGSVLMIVAANVGLRDRASGGRWFATIASLPVYWLLAAAAVYRALAEIFTDPFHWTKTEHGLEP